MSQKENRSVLPSSVNKSPSSDVNGIDWLARQNGGLFDPELFGDYRDTQNDLLNSDFFSEAFLNQDFNTPFNMPEDLTPVEPKKDLMQQVEDQKEAEHDEIVPAGPGEYLTCDKLWLVSPYQSLAPAKTILGIAYNSLRGHVLAKWIWTIFAVN